MGKDSLGQKRKDLDLYRVGLVDRYTRLGIGVEIFEELLEDLRDLVGRFGGGEKT